MISERDLGSYPVTIELKEVIDGAYLPGVKEEFILTILPELIVEPEPEPVIPDTDEKPPFAKIKSIQMDGKM